MGMCAAPSPVPAYCAAADLLRSRKRKQAYTLYLRTPEQSYEKDRIVFDSIVKSFMFTPE